MSKLMNGKEVNAGESTTLWKSQFYQLQKEAPKPLCILCKKKTEMSFEHYGLSFHGPISHRCCDNLLQKDGHFLVRWSESAQHCTLSLRFSGKIKHYRLYYENEHHYVGEKKFLNLDDLVADGLVTLYLELKAGKILHQLPLNNYQQSPYFTLTRSFRKAIQKNRIQIQRKHIENDLPDKNDTSTYGIINQENSLCHNEKETDIDGNSTLKPACNLNSSSDLSETDLTEIEHPHRFQPNSFTGLHWCGFCGNFLWGLILQGAKCQDCGFKAHRQCSLKVPNDCCPDLKDLHFIFGMDLSTCLQTSPFKEVSPPASVPPIVSDCITEVDNRGLTAEGIYRVSGSQEQIDALRLSFERDWNNVSLKEKSVPDVHVVAGLLKLYFRLLPLKLITEECFEKLIEANRLSVPDGKVLDIIDALSLLPISHYLTLKVFIRHLARICEYGAFNKMTATSLGTILGPTLVQMDSRVEKMEASDLLVLKMSSQEHRIIEMLIVLHKDIFID